MVDYIPELNGPIILGYCVYCIQAGDWVRSVVPCDESATSQPLLRAQGSEHELASGSVQLLACIYIC